MFVFAYGFVEARHQTIIITENNNIQAENLLAVCGIPFHSIPFSSMKPEFYEISGFCRGVNEIFAPQRFYTA
jgi:hypothetical protein